MKKQISQLKLALAVFSSVTQVYAQVDLSRKIKTFTSPNGVQESCVALSKLPMGDYKPGDVKEEENLCSIDFNDNATALCSKTWSTSPATIVHSFRDVDGKDLANSADEAENNLCGKDSRMDKVAKFKQTMNQDGTSGTYSGASILYYHLSRALDTEVDVPVAVYRSMDKDEHLRRVSAKARPPANAKMNVAGWNWLRSGENNPSSYPSMSDLFTGDRKQIYGTLLRDKGERYKEEINGTRESGWGKGQNMDFQKTPAFSALRSSATDLVSAINSGYAEAIKNPKMKAAVPTQPSMPQMVLWMNEVSEIAILDYIFSQQDRVGNIDYQWYWSYVDANGEVKADRVKDDAFKSLSRLSMGKIKMPAEIAARNPILVQKTAIGDNDAGGLLQYANFTKTTGMLEGMRHLNKDTYQRLLKLAQDFKAKGVNYQVLKSESALLNATEGNKRFLQTTGNTILAAGILEKNCRAGLLRLDLVSFKKAMKNELQTSATSCDIE